MCVEVSYENLPEKLVCQYCDGSDGHQNEVHTGNTEDGNSGWEMWFCCHACRDRGEPCETFYPLPLK